MDDKKHENQPYPALERLSLEELQNLLRQDYYASDEMDMGYIMAILEVIERQEAESPDEKLFNVEAGWKSFKENYMGKKSDYITDDPHDYSPENPPYISTTHRHNRHKLPRMVAAAAALILLCGILTAQAMGFNVFETIARWTTEIFFFSASDSEDSSFVSTEIPSEKEYSSLQVALDDIGVTQLVVPVWYPDGFVQTNLTVVPMSDRISLNAFFENGEKSLSISFMVYGISHDGHLRIYEKDANAVTEYEAGGITHYTMTNNGKVVTVWMNDNLECCIAGDITEPDMQKLIDSIYGG